jgi:hypothetical protein
MVGEVKRFRLDIRFTVAAIKVETASYENSLYQAFFEGDGFER